jgi:cytochrome c553
MKLIKYLPYLAAAVFVLAATAACTQAPPPPPPAPAAPVQSPVERGKYIVSAAGCDDCHTPLMMGPNGPEPKLDAPWMAAGSTTMTAWAGPWGISYTANLTPDQNTGLGIWTEDMFINAIRQGKHMGTSRPILPPMPWQVIKNYTDDDLKAIFAFLKSLPPVANHVPDPIIAEPKK